MTQPPTDDSAERSPSTSGSASGPASPSGPAGPPPGQQSPYGQRPTYGEPTPYRGQQQPNYAQQHQPSPYGQPPQPPRQPHQGGPSGYGQQPQHPYQGGPSPYDQQPSYGTGSPYGPPSAGPRAVKNTGGGLGAAFTDLTFTKSATRSLSSVIFVIVIVWAVVRYIARVYDAFQFTSAGRGVLELFTGLLWLIIIVGGTRLALELCNHVARLAGKSGDSSTGRTS